jgi:hypothetical protein
MAIVGIVNGPLSVFSTYACKLVAAYGTFGYINSVSDLNPGQKSVAKTVKADVDAIVIHSDVYLRDDTYHSSDLSMFKIEVGCNHPEAISEVIEDAQEFARYVAEKSWNYATDPGKPAEQALHDQLSAYKMPIGFFV